MASLPSKDHVFVLQQVSDLTKVVGKMASVTCTAPAQIDAGDSTEVNVLPGDTKYFQPVCKVLTSKMIVDVRDKVGAENQWPKPRGLHIECVLCTSSEAMSHSVV